MAVFQMQGSLGDDSAKLDGLTGLGVFAAGLQVKLALSQHAEGCGGYRAGKPMWALVLRQDRQFWQAQKAPADRAGGQLGQTLSEQKFSQRGPFGTPISLGRPYALVDFASSLPNLHRA